MYILNVTYTQPEDKVSPHVEGHTDWVKKYFADGMFLAAGPKPEKNGGVILAKNIERNELDKILADDPFVEFDVAKYDVVAFDCKLAQAGLDVLKS